ncbi:hypothetical protein ACLM5H_06780 [Fredinandcohnia humi]
MKPIDLIQSLFKHNVIHKLLSSQEFNHNQQNIDRTVNQLAKLTMASKGDQSDQAKSSTLMSITDSVEITSNDANQSIQLNLSFEALSNGITNAHIRFSGKKKENGKINPDHCHILFSLELEKLKETILDVRVQNRILTITVYNETKCIDILVEKLKPVLKNNLEDYGYTLSSVKVVQSKEGKSSPEGNVDRGFQNGVDLKI